VCGTHGFSFVFAEKGEPEITKAPSDRRGLGFFDLFPRLPRVHPYRPIVFDGRFNNRGGRFLQVRHNGAEFKGAMPGCKEGL
jgi:hypothetical protein